MIRMGMFAALLASAPAAASGLVCLAEGVPADAVELREAAINVAGFGEGDAAIAYASFLLPAGWSFEGVAEFGAADSCGLTEKARWRAEAPDGSVSDEMTPGDVWIAERRHMAPGPCPLRDIRDAYGYGASLLENAVPGAAIVDARDRPDITGRFRDQLPAAGGYGDGIEISSAEMGFRRNDDQGRREYGLLVAAVAIMNPNPFIEEFQIVATAFPSILARARDEEPDRDLVEMIRASALANPNWVRLRERLLGVGRPGDPRDRITWPPEKLPFPDREAGPATTACGREFSPLKVAHVWRSADGQIWFSRDLTAALEKRP